MKTTQTWRMVLVLAFGWLLAAGALRATDVAEYGMAAGSVSIPEGLSAAEVKKVILESAVGRGWNIVSKDDGKIVLQLDQERWSAKLTLLYTDRDVQIYSNSTRKGKPKLPDNWIHYLKQDITKKTGMLHLSKS